MYVHIYIDACYFYKTVQLYMCILKKQKIFLGNTRRTYIGIRTKTQGSSRHSMYQVACVCTY